MDPAAEPVYAASGWLGTGNLEGVKGLDAGSLKGRLGRTKFGIRSSFISEVVTKTKI